MHPIPPHFLYRSFNTVFASNIYTTPQTVKLTQTALVTSFITTAKQFVFRTITYGARGSAAAAGHAVINSSSCQRRLQHLLLSSSFYPLLFKIFAPPPNRVIPRPAERSINGFCLDHQQEETCFNPQLDFRATMGSSLVG
jgi:hypothetical protein